MVLISLFYVFLLVSTLKFSQASPIGKASNGRNPKVKFSKRYSSARSSTALQKRESPIGELYLTNGYVSYLVTVEVGTPAQEIEVYVDTGSADLWFQTPTSLDCSTALYSNYTSCNSLGVSYFVALDSSTIKYSHKQFLIDYESGYEVTNGTFVSDKVSIAGLTVPDLVFGLSYSTNSVDNSFLGLGKEAIEYNQDTGIYPNFLTRIFNEGLIDHKYFAIYLESQFSDGGSIEFGNIDPNYYQGELVEHKLVSETEYFIQSNGTFFGGLQIMGDEKVLIDTGSTVMTIPSSALKQIVNELNATWNSDMGAYQVNCLDYNTTAPELIFQFGNQLITISPLEYLLNYNIGANGQTEQVQDSEGNDMCLLGFDYDDTVILGDNFIRSVYAVFNLEKDTISLAQGKWVKTTDTTVPVLSSSAKIRSEHTSLTQTSCIASGSLSKFSMAPNSTTKTLVTTSGFTRSSIAQNSAIPRRSHLSTYPQTTATRSELGVFFHSSTFSNTPNLEQKTSAVDSESELDFQTREIGSRTIISDTSALDPRIGTQTYQSASNSDLTDSRFLFSQSTSTLKLDGQTRFETASSQMVEGFSTTSVTISPSVAVHTFSNIGSRSLPKKVSLGLITVPFLLY